MLADMVRTDSHQLRPAGDSPQAEAVKVLGRTHKALIWERTRAVQRLRHQLREYFPAALEAFEDLDAPDALELLSKASDTAGAAKLTRAQASAALKHARRLVPGRVSNPRPGQVKLAVDQRVPAGRRRTRTPRPGSSPPAPRCQSTGAARRHWPCPS